MAEKGCMGNSINLLYRDLVSEVNRRRITMTMRYSQPLGAGRGGRLGWHIHADAHQAPETPPDAGLCKCIQCIHPLQGGRFYG